MGEEVYQEEAVFGAQVVNGQGEHPGQDGLSPGSQRSPRFVQSVDGEVLQIVGQQRVDAVARQQLQVALGVPPAGQSYMLG